MLSLLHQVLLEEAKAFRWKCPKCGGRIKKGVRDRILELADTTERPKDRPPYLHLAPSPR